MSLDGRFLTAPTLPTEILDEIMDIAVRTMDLKFISSITLISNKHRILANNARFSSVKFGSPTDRVEETHCRRLDNLADLLRAGNLVDTIPSVAAFITSFSLEVSGTTEALRPLLHNGSLAYVFQNLFRSSAHAYSPRSGSRSISLEIRDWSSHERNMASAWDDQQSVQTEDIEEQGDDSEETFLEWSLTGSALTVVFIEFLLNSQVTSLHLSKFENIPINFLLGTKLQHLSLGDVSFCEPDETEEYLSQEPVTTLRSAEISGMARVSFEIFVRLLCNQPPPLQSTFTLITQITFSLGLPRQMEMLNEVLKYVFNLEYLCLKLFGSPLQGRDGCSIGYTHLPCLKTVQFQSYDSGASFRHIASLLGHSLPPNLGIIKISTNEMFGRDTLDVARGVLDLYPFDILDKHFSHRSFNVIHKVVVFFSVFINCDYDPRTFDVAAYKKEYHTVVMSKFPLCMRRDPPIRICVPLAIKMSLGNGSIQL